MPKFGNKQDKLACAIKASNGENFLQGFSFPLKNSESVVQDDLEPLTLLDRTHEQVDSQRGVTNIVLEHDDLPVR